MAHILEEGHYPEKNKVECESCKCYFEYYDTEIVVETSTPLEMDTFCGWGIHKYVVCPQCNHKNTLLCEFYEDPSIFDGISRFIDKIKNIFKKKEGNENGKNRNIKSK